MRCLTTAQTLNITIIAALIAKRYWLGLSRVTSRLDRSGRTFWCLVWMISLQIWAVAVDMLGSLVHHLAHWFIWQSHANRPSHHKLGIARHVSIGGLFHLSPSFLPLFMDRLCFAISLS